MKEWPTLHIKSWKDLIEKLEFLKLETDWLSHYLFRGQSDDNWSLKPSILRILEEYDIERELGLKFELTIYREFISRAHLYPELKFPEVQMGKFGLINSIMQHFGAPTRLLDWTTSPYIALYFAVRTNFDKDGAVFLFNQTVLGSVLKNNFYDSDKDNIFIESSESSYLTSIITNFETLRYNFQQGCFTVAADIKKDHYKLIYEALQSQITKNGTPFCILKIDKTVKHEFLARLRKLNIKPDILFPDIEGFANMLKDLMQIRGWEKSLNK